MTFMSTCGILIKIITTKINKLMEKQKLKILVIDRMMKENECLYRCV